MITKWLWYINAAIGALAVIILLTGLTRLGQSRPQTSRDGGQSRTFDKTGSQADKNGDNESPMVKAVGMYSRRWEPPVGLVTITITPQQAIEEGGLWRIKGNSWKKSGATLKHLSVGTHTVTFKPLGQWLSPAAVTVKIAKRETTSATAAYTPKPPPEYGSLNVTITPQEAIDAGGQWRAGTGDWKNSGEIDGKILIGQQSVTLKPVVGWNTHAGLMATISKDQTTTTTAKYTKKPLPQFGSVTVTISPPEAARDGAGWRVKETTKSTPKIVTNDKAKKPINPTTKKKTTETIKTIKPPAQVGNWHENGATLDNIVVGIQTIEFKPLGNNWSCPKVVSVTIEKDQTAAVSGTYHKPKPPKPKFTLTGTLMGLEGGLAWFKTPTEKKDKAYIVGELIGNYSLTRVMDGSVVLTRDGHEYTIEISKVKEPPTPKPQKEAKKTPPTRRLPNRKMPTRTPGKTPKRTLPKR